jgi:hypothetical protein
VVGGLTPRCTCKAGKCKVAAEQDVTEGCKHRDALLWLIAEELIEVPGGAEASEPVYAGEPGEMTRAELAAA